jgi:outer membrane protein assembly factor BamB
VLDPADGEVLRCVDLGPLGDVTTVGSDVLGVGIAGDAHAEAGRWSLLTGEREWSYRSADVMPPSDSWDSSIDASVVRLDIGPWSLSLDAETGERIPGRRPRVLGARDVPGSVSLPDGSTASSRFSASGPPTTTVRAPDGSDRATFPGLLVIPAVDDGSAGDLVLVVRAPRRGEPPGIVGVDPSTGESPWESAAPVGRVAVVQGVLLVDGDHGISAHDPRTGAVRWEATAPRPADGMVTDGSRVLTLETGPDGALLTARDVVTGTLAWTTPAGVADPSLALLPDGTVVAAGAGELVALRR